MKNVLREMTQKVTDLFEKKPDAQKHHESPIAQQPAEENLVIDTAGGEMPDPEARSRNPIDINMDDMDRMTDDDADMPPKAA